jgi:SAM-dependent methyltransferase
MIHLKSIVKGAGSLIIPQWQKSGTGDVGAATAVGSYATFFRYFDVLNFIRESFEDKVVLELGPGPSYGLGFCALFCGARRYYAVDYVDHTNIERNLRVFDDLVEMFKARISIPHDGLCGQIFPFIDNEEFVSNLAANDLRLGRIEAIRDDLINRKGNFILPMKINTATTLPPSIDVIISESVMEHVDNLEATYAAFARWLKPGGVMVHLIDYGSHKLSSEWNGHWGCSEKLWRIVRGKRQYLINRQPHQTHLDLMKVNGFQIVSEQRLRRVDGLTREQFDLEFMGMSFVDSQTSLAQVVARKL